MYRSSKPRRDEISDKQFRTSGIRSARRLENSKVLFNTDMSVYIGYRVSLARVSRSLTKPADQTAGSKPTAFLILILFIYISSQRSDMQSLNKRNRTPSFRLRYLGLGKGVHI